MNRLEFAHVRDLRPGQKIRVRCRQCRHIGEVEVERICRKYRGLTPLLLVREKLRCTNCQTKGLVDVNATDALSWPQPRP